MTSFFLGLFGFAALVHSCAPVLAQSAPVKVFPDGETRAVNNEEDAADDSAVWVHPTDASRSLIIGTDKREALVVFDLSGEIVQQLPDGRMNNTDVLYGFACGDRRLDLVGATERTTNSIALYAVDPESGRLSSIAARPIVIDGPEVYGFCMMRSRATGSAYAFVATMPGLVQQWRLFDTGGAVDAELVRSFWVGGQIEGVVADEAHNALFVGEEDVGIWRYEAEPAWLAAGFPGQPEDDDAMEESARVLIAQVGRDPIAADVEGLTMYRLRDDDGYLLASSQGDSTFAVFARRSPHEYLFSFALAEHAGVDEVTGTDGIDACSASLGPNFPHGIVVVQDDENPGSRQNFKFVRWERIAGAAPIPLRLSGGVSPRE